jgi:hypothetical protein
MIEKLRRSLMSSLTESSYTNSKLSRGSQLPYIQRGMKYSIGNLKEVNRRERGRVMYGKNETMEVMSLRRERVTLK